MPNSGVVGTLKAGMLGPSDTELLEIPKLVPKSLLALEGGKDGT